MAIGIPLVIVGTMLEQACRRYFPNVSLDWLFNEKKHKWISLSSVLLGATFLDVEAKSAEAIQFLVISSFGLFAIWFGTFFINGDRHRRLIVGWSLILFALWVVIINRA